ncbi:MAG: electron transport complex subunit RsxB [Proteobacteria bacterium]|nr:electron transport complex subunit RsxB [Pseudomonadota bacterium]
MPGELTIPLEDEQLALRIDALLPQTQCRKCGYSGCKPYAQAIAQGKADINQCPPGGDQGIRKLAALLGRPYLPLNPEHGVEKPRELAFIDEGLCIGCTLCIQACPVDAIVGAAKQMHTIVAELCTGCELCVPPCPVDCISMLPLATDAHEYPADAARERHEFRQFREERERQEKTARLATKAASLSSQSAARQDGVPPSADQAAAIADKKALIAAAIARAQQQKAQVKPANTAQLTAEQLAQIAEIEARRK